MDSAVALVNAYLHVQGYFTVAEYPVIKRDKHESYSTVTEPRILAIRFPGHPRHEHKPSWSIQCCMCPRNRST